MPKTADRGGDRVANTSMVCVVPKQNVEILGRALHALARIGDELYVEPLNGGLTFRTVHHNHSVYAEVHFTNQFFSFYNHPTETPDANRGDEANNALNCRINMKSYLAAFRSLPCLRKQVETCLLQIEPTWLIVKFRCHHSLIRTYRLPVIESETLQAIYTVDEVPNQLVIGADVFSTAVKNFQCSERDITLAVEKQKAMLRNYVPGGTDPTGVVRSELKLDAGEFISFTVGQETAITFCLKTFRALLYFSEPANLPLAVKFSLPGCPVVIISKSSTFELRFVLSSLSPEDCDNSRNDSQQLLTPLQPLGGNKRAQKRKEHPGSSAGSSSINAAWENAENGISKAPPLSTKNKSKPKVPSKLDLKVGVTNHRSSVSAAQPIFQEIISSSNQINPSAASSTGAVVGLSSQDSIDCRDKARKPIPFNRLVIPPSDEETDGDDEDEENEEDVVPASPPSTAVKKSRLIFQRCFDPTLDSEALLGSEVLAYDTDEN